MPWNMSEARGIRLAPSAAVKERRLATLLAGRDLEGQPELQRAVWDAQLCGCCCDTSDGAWF